MRFEDVGIGEVFVSPKGPEKCEMFRKKSLSSAYYVNTETFESREEHIGFSKAAPAYRLAKGTTAFRKA